MYRTIAAGWLVLALVATAWADRLILADGRTFTGTVTVEGDTVRIDMAYGTLRFSRNDVLRIELKDTPEAQLEKRLAQTSLDDPDALYQLAEWAREHSLDRQAGELYRLILKLDTDHAGARARLGYARVDNRWLEFDKALELARSKLQAGQTKTLMESVLPALDKAAGTPERRQAVGELRGLARIGAKDFAGAQETFASLAKSTEGAQGFRYATLAGILKDNPDGMYVLSESYPPAASLFGETAGVVKPGPASLARPLVLQAALHDKAKNEIEAGRKILDEAAKIEPTDPDAAKAKYFQASQAFDRAEALVPDITKSWRIEICRRRIASLRKDVKADVLKFDQENESLGKSNLAPDAYRARLKRLLHRLDSIREDLQSILTIAKPYPRELVMEIGWTQRDLTMIGDLRQRVVEEMNDQ